jgi:hypothetical protein
MLALPDLAVEHDARRIPSFNTAPGLTVSRWIEGVIPYKYVWVEFYTREP